MDRARLISPWTGEFSDSDLEARYRLSSYESQRRQLLYIASIFLAALVPVGYVEYLNAGDRDGFALFMAGHVFSGILIGLMFVASFRRWPYARIDLLVLVFVVYVIAEAVFLINLYRNEVILIVIRLPLYAVVGNLMVVMSARYRIIMNILALAAFVGAIWILKPLNSEVSATITVVIALSLGLGYVGGTWLGWLRRKEFSRRLDLEESQRRLEDALAAKSLFLANISHELRTPLNAILGFSEVLQKQMLGPLGAPQYSEYVEDIHQSGKHLLNLIDDLLDLNRLELGKADMNPEWVDPAIDAAIWIKLAASGAAGGDTSRMRIGHTESVETFFDRRALKQIILNLLTNALKYSGDRAVITFTVVISDNELRLAVTDDGQGMDPAALDRLLRPFEQMDGTMTRETKGWGLGLPLVAGLAEANGAHFEIRSAPGEGTCAEVVIPPELVRSPDGAPILALAGE